MEHIHADADDLRAQIRKYWDNAGVKYLPLSCDVARREVCINAGLPLRAGLMQGLHSERGKPRTLLAAPPKRFGMHNCRSLEICSHENPVGAENLKPLMAVRDLGLMQNNGATQFCKASMTLKMHQGYRREG